MDAECTAAWEGGIYGHQQSLRWELQRQNYYIDISEIFSWRVKPKMPQKLKYNTQLIISVSFVAVILTSEVDYAYAFQLPCNTELTTYNYTMCCETIRLT